MITGLVFVKKRLVTDELEDDSKIDIDDVNMVDIPYLPANVTLHDGLEITVRSMRRDEIRIFYDALKAAARSGAGYGYDELPSFAYFARWYVDGYCNVVYETKTSSSNQLPQIVAFASFGPSTYSRDAKSVLADANLVLAPELRGKRLASEIITINGGLSRDMGLGAIYGEMAATNVASLRAGLARGSIVTGSIPKGIFFKDKGWVDLIMFYSPPGTILSFKEQTLNAKL